MKIVEGNILDIGYGIVGHQVNCQSVMGAGLARQIRERYPRVFEEYKLVMGKMLPKHRLGKCQMVEIIFKKLYFANLFGQYDFIPRGIVHTDYNALAMALRGIQRWRTTVLKLPVYLPFGLGCGLAGGDWKVVFGIIQDAIPDATIIKLRKNN